ncbi:helix-turn-helix transcriptional regulator [Devosia sp.]|uniref:helix-turn-helix transcriptional regulator n=1 Tax=Devosia sp. TaxID=1871048 RepID=UPI0032666045
MLALVERYLKQIHDIRTDADIVLVLGNLAESLGYRSGYLLEFGDEPGIINLWDSDRVRFDWWTAVTAGGTRSISRSLAEIVSQGGVQSLRVPDDDPRAGVARQYDFFICTIVPITLDHQTKGIASFSGERVLNPAETMTLQVICFNLFSQVRSLPPITTLRPVSLTPREQHVMSLCAEGMTSEEIAAALTMSPRTVNQHVDNIAAKLGTRNRTHTVAEVIRRGLF